jgi:hypothetical protein
MPASAAPEWPRNAHRLHGTTRYAANHARTASNAIHSPRTIRWKRGFAVMSGASGVLGVKRSWVQIPPARFKCKRPRELSRGRLRLLFRREVQVRTRVWPCVRPTVAYSLGQLRVGLAQVGDDLLRAASLPCPRVCPLLGPAAVRGTGSETRLREADQFSAKPREEGRGLVTVFFSSLIQCSAVPARCRSTFTNPHQSGTTATDRPS